MPGNKSVFSNSPSKNRGAVFRLPLLAHAARSDTHLSLIAPRSSRLLPPGDGCGRVSEGTCRVSPHPLLPTPHPLPVSEPAFQVTTLKTATLSPSVSPNAALYNIKYNRHFLKTRLLCKNLSYGKA